MVKIDKFSLIYLFSFFIFLIFPTKATVSQNFLSLKNQKVNLRQGPSFEYPVKFIYKKKYLPILIIDKSDAWRKIKDFENNSGWIHISQLSNRKSGINIKDNSIIYKNSTIFSKPIAKLQVGRMVLIIKCKVKWCKIKTGDYDGWILKNYLWGKIN